MKTKIVYNDKFLDKIGFLMKIGGITLYPYIVLREKYKDDRIKKNKVTLNHEKIHIEQQKELLVIFFYIFYILEYVLKGFSYNRISFEKEAYKNANNMEYLKTRKRYSFFKYIGYGME